MELCVARAGGTWRAIPKGLRVCQFIIEWALLSAIEDRPITLPEYRRFFGEPERTAYRHLGEFRELFGEEFNGYSDPQPIADHLKANAPAFHPSRMKALRELGGNRKAGVRDLDVTSLLNVPVAL